MTTTCFPRTFRGGCGAITAGVVGATGGVKKSVIFFLFVSSGYILQQYPSLAQFTPPSPPLHSDKNNTQNLYEDLDEGQEEDEDDFVFTYSSLTNRKLEAIRNRWQDTFRDIKTLVVPSSYSSSRKTQLSLNSTVLASRWFNEWKLFLKDDDDNTPDDDIEETTYLSSRSTLPSSFWNPFPSVFTKKSHSFRWRWNPKKWRQKVTTAKEDSFKHSNIQNQDPRIISKQNQRLRFNDGVTSWENLLQQWADDATEYLASIGGNYSVSSMTLYPNQKNKKSQDTSSTNLLQILFSRTRVYGDTTRKKTAKKVQTFKPRPVIPGEPIVPHTDLSDKSKHIWIVTTAALPWMTGTAVNPLLRAAYLCEGRWNSSSSPLHPSGNVTLMIPWLEKASDRDKLYGKKYNFTTCQDQEMFIRNWLRNSANMGIAADQLFIEWYVGWLEPLENSVYSMGDITGQIPVERADVVVLEEPEHLNWYRAPGDSWTRKFKHVVGIVHTNYFVYAQEQPAALIRAPALRLMCSWMCRAHSHRLIKLSGTLGIFAPEKELVENVHGVRQTFLDYGISLCSILQDAEQRKSHPVFGAEATPTIYFIGKMLWSKGIGSLMDLMKYAEETSGLKLKVDMYGGGPDKDEADSRAQRLNLDMTFHGPIDHSALTSTHKIFVNPSTSEVLCTTVAEALAMGKFVVVPSHPSNDFFAQFPNCLTYTNKEEFIGNIYYALTHAPEPLTEEYAYALSWNAAMERFEAAGSISVAEAEALSDAVTSSEASIEIDLPPLIEDKERRKQISQTVQRTRLRFRQFRDKLSQEIRQIDVLPKELQQKLVAELDKRLDVDVDILLGSPKLKIQLSPAELDRQLLDLYNNLSESPSGDIFRVIGGGSTVGRQNYYLRQQALKAAREKRLSKRNADRARFLPTLPQLIDGDETAASTWVQRALRRNQVELSEYTFRRTTVSENEKSKSDTLQMTHRSSNNNHITIQNNMALPRSISHSTFCRRSFVAQSKYQPLI